ncbi:MAG: hypothetical protein KDG55_23270, partial [Rhodocyclaceae bacterium]|nr:hypothetical protein [Rhodocyclaceae bacterium]
MGQFGAQAVGLTVRRFQALLQFGNGRLHGTRVVLHRQVMRGIGRLACAHGIGPAPEGIAELVGA